MRDERISKRGFLWAYCGSFGFAIFMAFVGGVFAGILGSYAGVSFIVATAISIIFFIVTHFVFIYRIWKEIQDGETSTSAGLAVGLLFIPIFNLYWIFHVLTGFVREYNALLKRHQAKLPRLKNGVYLAYAILTSMSFLMGAIGLFFVRVSLSGHPSPENPMQVFAVMVISTVSLMNQLMGIAIFVLGILIISRSCDAINKLPPLRPVEINYQSSMESDDLENTT
ncbi:MAG: hypothetical protein JW941_13620 [Candidatus Coatesbacteria bacterium]|nr:hypothetical protein [Candidatus Coatesbacteria bacterium]